MGALLKLARIIEWLLAAIAKIGAAAGLMLVFVVMFDVVTRYFGVPKPFGLNSTQVQESEFWLHTVLFSLVIGYAYMCQGHVRIDLLRDRLSPTAKYILEILGCLLFLIPFCLVAIKYHLSYVHASYLEGEVSKSVIGLSHIWILKAFLPTLFILLLLAAIAQLIRSVAGLMGKLPDDEVARTIGGGH